MLERIIRMQSNDVKILKHNSLSSWYEKVMELQAIRVNRLPEPLWTIYTVQVIKKTVEITTWGDSLVDWIPS